MPGSISRPVDARKLGRMYWLPPGGQGNGLDDDAWAVLLEVPGEMVQPVLDTLRNARVPAYAAMARPSLSPRAGRSAAPGYRVWVGTSAYGRAQDTLIALLPSLTRPGASSRLPHLDPGAVPA
jgi:hypothetical protein